MTDIDKKPFYIIRYVYSRRVDGRKPWTKDNTRSSIEIWDQNFNTIDEAKKINKLEMLDGKIYLVQPVEAAE